MRRISFVLCVVGGTLISSTAAAQCHGGTSGATTGTTATATGGTTVATGTSGALLTGPGSWAYDMMLAQAMQRQVAQQQYMLAQQRQAARQQQLEARRDRAEQQRARVAASRERNRQRLLAASGSAAPAASRYVVMDTSGHR